MNGLILIETSKDSLFRALKHEWAVETSAATLTLTIDVISKQRIDVVANFDLP